MRTAVLVVIITLSDVPITLSFQPITLSVVRTTQSIAKIYSVSCTHYFVSCTHYSVSCTHCFVRELPRKIGLLNKMRTHLPIRERELFYNSLIKPIIMYGSMVWTSCSYNDLKRILRLEKRAARIILGVQCIFKIEDSRKF